MKYRTGAMVNTMPKIEVRWYQGLMVCREGKQQAVSPMVSDQVWVDASPHPDLLVCC
jgi:hypothetical protein